MAEPLFAIAAVSSIVALVDFTSKIISRLNGVYSGTSDIPKSLSHLKADLPLLRDVLKQIQEAIDAGRFPKECAAVIGPVIEGCEQSMCDIESILDKTLPTQGDRKTKKFMKSVGSVWNAGKVESITTTLRGHTGTLTFYFTALASLLQPLTDVKLVKIRKWLSAPDPSINFEKALKLREPKTGLWLLESDLYKDWKANTSTVWLHGIPGCGKTVLSSTVLEDIRNFTQKDPGKALAYFFFDFNDRQKQDPEMMVRSLVAQLSQQCIQISPNLNALFLACENGQRQPSLDSLLKTLQELVNEFPLTYLIVDALDECENRRELMSIINSIKDVDRDIQLYVHQRLADDESLRKWHADERIKTSVGKKARGMFRLAACQLDTFPKCRNRKQLQHALNNLPSDLDEMYNRMLGAIEGADIRYAVRILRWLVYSRRPLSMAEVAEIAALDAHRCPAFDRDEVLEDHSDVLRICSSLVNVTAEVSFESYQSSDAEVSIVRLAHYSVQEYLTSTRILEGSARLYYMEAGICHKIITKCCVQYLLQFDEPSALTEENLHEYALAIYSAKEWLFHARSSTRRDPETVRLLAKLLDTDTEACLTWYRLFDSDDWRGPDFKRSSDGLAPSLYYASYGGLTDVARFLIDEGTTGSVNAISDHGTALQTASHEGHLDTVKLLVECGADVDLVTDAYESALHVASHDGRLSVVQYLVENGAEVNLWAGGSSPLTVACESGHVEIVELLLKIGAEVNSRTHHSSPITIACEGGHVEIVELLLKKGADVNFRTNGGWPLTEACRRGYVEIVELLLKNGADVEARRDWEETALQTAAHQRHVAVVQRILEAGADINATSHADGTALATASRQGHLDVCKLLLEKGADPNSPGGYYGNPLQVAAVQGYLDITQLLIENSADVNLQGGYHSNALQAAVCMGRLEVVQLLIKNGADVNLQSRVYGNALQAAAYKGHLDIAQLLIKNGADVSLQGGTYGNALQAALVCRHWEVADLLIKNGADVNLQDAEYSNAMRAAAIGGHLDIAQLLIKEGADVNMQGGWALQTALHWEKWKFADFLIENGAQATEEEVNLVRRKLEELDVEEYEEEDEEEQVGD